MRRYWGGVGWKGRLLGVTDGFIVFPKSDLCCCSVHVSQSALSLLSSSAAIKDICVLRLCK